jgi:hypothetical protein
VREAALQGHPQEQETAEREKKAESQLHRIHLGRKK